MSCLPCKVLSNCLRLGQFATSSSTDTLYTNVNQALNVSCPNGQVVNVEIPAGVIGYVVTFQIGNPPYPNLVLDCPGGLISIAVPNGTTQSQLVTLVNQLLNQCAEQVALQNGCTPSTYTSNQQQWAPPCSGSGIQLAGATVTGISIDPTGTNIVVNAGVATSSTSQSDADGKALLLAQEAFYSGNITCVT